RQAGSAGPPPANPGPRQCSPPPSSAFHGGRALIWQTPGAPRGCQCQKSPSATQIFDGRMTSINQLNRIAISGNLRSGKSAETASAARQKLPPFSAYGHYLPRGNAQIRQSCK